MKKTFVILFALLSGAYNLPAQQGFFGLQAGLNLSSLSSTDLSSVKSKAGYHAGLMFNFRFFNNHLSLMPSLLYSTKGFKYEYTNTVTSTVPDTSGGTVTSTVNVLTNVDATLGYLDVPVLLSLFLSENKGFFFQAGPQFSFLITDNATVNSTATISQNGGQPKPTTSPIDNKIHFNSADMSVMGGIGFKLPHYLLIYARISSGVIKVQKDAFINSSSAGHNIVYQVGAALTFP